MTKKEQIIMPRMNIIAYAIITVLVINGLALYFMQHYTNKAYQSKIKQFESKLAECKQQLAGSKKKPATGKSSKIVKPKTAQVAKSQKPAKRFNFRSTPKLYEGASLTYQTIDLKVALLAINDEQSVELKIEFEGKITKKKAFIKGKSLTLDSILTKRSYKISLEKINNDHNYITLSIREVRL